MSEGEIFIAGKWIAGSDTVAVLDKFDGKQIARVGVADRAQTRAAVVAARRAFAESALTPYRRYEVLMAAAEILRRQRGSVVETLVAETGFTRKDAENDFARALETMTQSAEEARRIVGEMIPIQGAPGQRDERLAFTIRMPVGVVCAITPFNSPLNTVLHKVAPAIAAGNAVVLKPATYTPLSAITVCRTLSEAGLPAGLLNMVIGGGSTVGNWLLEDQDIDYYTFTGSTEVGKIIQQAAGLRRTQLELGNISSTIVCADAALEAAAVKCAGAAFRKAGQVCTSVQRVLVDQRVADEFTRLLVKATEALPVGDPRKPETVVGPMIDLREAERAERWVLEAIDGGARALTPVRREGPLLWPVILQNVGPDLSVACQEVFAPILSIVPVAGVDEAIQIANDTPFGLAAGIFTSDLSLALSVVRRLRMGNVHVNETSSSRVDLMPYGGLKESGFGREGPRYAIHDMSEERLITLNPI
jgi:acyl-CoA reductase-like NAD-dependent aldehyde dehydrogenase